MIKEILIKNCSSAENSGNGAIYHFDNEDLEKATKEIKEKFKEEIANILKNKFKSSGISLSGLIGGMIILFDDLAVYIVKEIFKKEAK